MTRAGLEGATQRSSALSFEEEAEECRRKALAYVGRPEAPFLIKVAREFDRLASAELFAGRDQR